jgi:membrane-bound lytic murein transglycosylase B
MIATATKIAVLVIFAAALILPNCGTARAQEGATPQPTGFDKWLVELKAEAQAKGISAGTLDAALTGLTPLKRVVELDRRQPEFTQTFRTYLNKRVSDWRVRTGRERLASHRELLDEVGRKFGVQPRFIVALWGIETSFGRATGGFSVVQALATLAYDGRRSSYFRRELFNALRIIDAGHISTGAMMGSWAGAMGQNQFMPSSFLSYAVDYDGDGRRDIWGTLGDVFASAANYLKRVGWRADQTWGREVKIPPGLGERFAELMPAKPPRGCRALKKLSAPKSLPDWQALGVRRTDGSDLPKRPLAASLVLPEGPKGPAFLVYRNFRATLKWNCSILFAATVGILADRLKQR